MGNNYINLLKDVQDAENAAIIEQYRRWVSIDKYLLFRCVNSEGFDKFVWRKQSKRGNDVYCRRTKQRFDSKLALLPDIDVVQKNSRGLLFSDLLLVTLTYDNRNTSASELWQQESSDFHRFLSLMRHHYGKIEFLRSYESHKSGYPHIHVMLRFRKKRFECSTINGVVRVVGEQFKKIKSCWKYGFSDIVAVKSVGDVAGYIGKYITKAAQDNGDVLTLAMLWQFRKRAFGFSVEFFNDLITLLPNRKPRIVTETWEYVASWYDEQELIAWVKSYHEQEVKRLRHPLQMPLNTLLL